MLLLHLDICVVWAKSIYTDKAMQRFVFSGDFLLDKYDGATEVKVNRRGRLSMRDPRFSVPTANDLVYLDDSPNYCLPNNTLGSLGSSISLEDITFFFYRVFSFRKSHGKVARLLRFIFRKLIRHPYERSIL